MYSSMKLLKYWLRMRRLGPIKAVSWRCSSLLVMWAIYKKTGCTSAKRFNQRLVSRGTPARTYHQLAGDLRDGHAEGEQVQAAVALKQVAGRLLENDESQGEHEPDLRAGTQHTGVLHRWNFSQEILAGSACVCMCVLSYSDS